MLVVSFHEFSCVSQVLYKFSLAYESYIFQFIVLLISPRFTSGFVPFDDLLVWQTHIMPPRRSRPRTAAGSLQLQTAVLQALSLPQLREICQTNGLSATGTRATLTKRLKDAGIALENERGEQIDRQNNPSPPTADPPAQERPQSFSNEQMATIKRLVQEAVSDAATGIASEAAKAAVNAMKAQQSPPFAPADAILPTKQHQQQQQVLGSPLPSQETRETVPGPSLGIAASSLQNGAPFQDIPSAYVKEIQTGEFFDLSKLLPKNLSIHDEGDTLVLSLDNSVVRVSKKKTSGAAITDIDHWTTAFTAYMSVFTKKFPQRSQELLQYLTLIRYAARVHKGLGWAVYDHKFRQKASNNKSLVWSAIDNQLWLTIFTVAPSVLQEEYPLFKKGPFSSVSTGAVSRGTCHSFNRNGYCSRDNCRFKHACAHCSGPHPESKCSSIPNSQREREGDRDRGRSNGGSTSHSSHKGK